MISSGQSEDDLGNGLKIVVGIPTAGRPDVLDKTVEIIAHQTKSPVAVMVCPASTSDIHPQLLDNYPYCKLVLAKSKGLASQRNSILAAIDDADLIVFFDDDFFPASDYLAQVQQTFLTHPDVVAVTGRPLKDGINGPGLSVEEGLEALSVASPVSAGSVSETYGTYGCNMAFRLSEIRARSLLFDENLPLYGWQEDIDFSRRLAAYGRIVSSSALQGVHLGSKGGRTSGLRTGYSQIANPVYLMRKGTMSFSFASRLMIRNLAANLVRSFWPEAWIDRKGRLKGNVTALVDVMIGRISPSRILDM